MEKRIYWKTADPVTIRRIRERFGIPGGISVNGETPLPPGFDTGDPLLLETERRGFIQIRFKSRK